MSHLTAKPPSQHKGQVKQCIILTTHHSRVEENCRVISLNVIHMLVTLVTEQIFQHFINYAAVMTRRQ